MKKSICFNTQTPIFVSYSIKMKYLVYLLTFFSLLSCKKDARAPLFTIAFGSCDNQQIANPFWEDIQSQQPDLWIWGGDVIYSDTEDMNALAANYNIQKNDTTYQNFIENVPILGTWDDHDYGVNDGGNEYPKQEASQQLFLDFIDVPKNDIRRQQAGVYHSEVFLVKNKKIKIIILDTRYFRSPLTVDNESDKRYKPNIYGEGSMLGEKQWQWLETQLSDSDANYHILMSSVQFLSDQHGFESWGNMPHEVEKMEQLILDSKAKSVIILSGDRHISEISKKEIGKLKYPLIDFTSSGMTHSYDTFTSELNPYRVSKVVSQKSYGILKIDLKTDRVQMEMWGENKQLLESYTVTYHDL